MDVAVIEPAVTTFIIVPAGDFKRMENDDKLRVECVPSPKVRLICFKTFELDANGVANPLTVMVFVRAVAHELLVFHVSYADTELLLNVCATKLVEIIIDIITNSSFCRFLLFLFIAILDPDVVLNTKITQVCFFTKSI
jgi:hypothetical protein